MADISDLLTQFGKNIAIDPETQKELNKPLSSSEVSEADTALLSLIMEKLDKGEIKPFVPSSIINAAVYDTLPPASQAVVEMNAFNFLSKIREIKSLHDAGLEGTYQVQNLVHHLRVIKERLEQLGGDVFLI